MAKKSKKDKKDKKAKPKNVRAFHPGQARVPTGDRLRKESVITNEPP